MWDVRVDGFTFDHLSTEEFDQLTHQLQRMLDAAGLAEQPPIELHASLWFTDDEHIHQLNREYRDKDRPTDVLAFAQREGVGSEFSMDELGDVIISVETALGQAKRGLAHELLFLSAHGLCHLLGYDHQTDEEEAEMNARANALMVQALGSGDVCAA